MTGLGVVFRPQLPPERLRAFARTVEGSGLDELWLWEDCFLEGGVSTAAAALAWTERLRVGVGLLPVPLRNVAVTAMETAALHRMFPGRASVVVGHGVQDWMGQVGARAASPLTLLGEHLDALRGLLRGEKLTVRGRYVTLDGVALDWPPSQPVPVLTGATGPRTLRLSGAKADGTLLTCATSPDGVRRARRLIEEGRAQAGRDAGPHRVVVYLLAATGAGAAERVRADLAAEGAQPGAGVAGDAAAVADAVRRLTEAGADTVVLQPTSNEPDPEGFVRFAADRVRPLLP
ncbi:Flavin-dependent oxidoreductase, luciferase family (includes alkanesulfonate monooxygenase SsuD and methylene tetrahydromethanopterin reductase) [Streptomyces misionensis]|uniref:Flavin-dependent oxidoreductase, luciferase family (Includes alkanesulfonate monooxygenase SsuD and methylene tetrahydromethanopterin reductase) n=1 Tax=Streptomyces misionensis TaxID=67331 RepID=A0A1H5B7D1_9ACTN|nr:LLM class flavin-dependent oxidoreductase [Streptomyces misionensis]SED50138.1 Flavin-dependent oxidoreductase, luciferase family (includes alkanesulfonate monooxygenase SsuD and methylene tetrahydromethanopterin reductase) [Streptomyces misionensis]